MIGASKILTVSYGTFSCTLEGFDEPFNTMKAIAEYFRDLAAEDRYFGAEPPVPDAAMLHRIAEREIQRRVEAKIQDNGVILRAGDAAPMTEAPAEALPAPTPAVSAAPVRMPEPTPEPAIAARAAPAIMPAAPQLVESAAARLSRIRAETAARVAAEPARMPVVMAPIASTAFIDDAYVEDDEPVMADTAPQMPHDFDLPEPALVETADLQPAPAAETLTAQDDAADDLVLSDMIADAPVQAARPVAEPDVAELIDTSGDDLLIDTLSGLLSDDGPDRAVTFEDSSAGDTADQSFLDTLAGVLSQDAPDAAPAAFDAPSEPDAEDQILPEAAEILDEPAPQADEIEGATLAQAMAEPEPAPEPVPEATPEAAYEPADEAAPMAEAEPKIERARARVIRVRRIDPKPAPRAEEPVEAANEAPNEAPNQVAQPAPVKPIKPSRPVSRQARGLATPEAFTEAFPEIEPEVEPALTLSAEDEAQLAAELAALEGESHASAPDPVTQAEVDADADLDLSIDADLAQALGGPLAPDAKAALVAAQQPDADEVDADIAAALAAETVEDPVATEPEPARDAAAMGSDPVSEAAVARLIEQTNSALEVPETKRRRSAIEHLKAAVRATLAERKVNPNADAAQVEERKDPYRRDLDSVVRPAAAVTAPARTGDRPPPLVLVSAQRIDRKPASEAPLSGPVAVPDAAPAPAPQNVMPVRPRRLNTGSLAMQEIADNFGLDDDETEADAMAPAAQNIFSDAAKLPFSTFVDQISANGLSDLLEAAAAYNAVVLDRPQFPRQTLFQHLAALGGASEPSREDGLRSFGKLLREGRIVKTQRGQFGLPDDSQALIEAKRLLG